MKLLLAYVVFGFLWADSVSGQAFRCEDATACYPPNDSFFPQGSVIPGAYVDCVGGQCICRGPCFQRNNDTNSCDFANPSCMKYDTETLTCKDKRKSQLVAFLLALFCGYLGAANFFIGRLSFAIPQLFLNVIACCGGMAMDKENPGKTVACTTLLTGLAVGSWWLADIIIFASGNREDGDGCPLRPDL